MSHVYHFTTSAHLPRILESGELHAMKVTPELLAYERSLIPFGSTITRPEVELLSATTSTSRERTATMEYGAPDFFNDGDMSIVRFTLEIEDFEPWKQVCKANGYSAEWIKILADTARGRGSEGRRQRRVRARACSMTSSRWPSAPTTSRRS
jgi:hypothetical protein